MRIAMIVYIDTSGSKNTKRGKTMRFKVIDATTGEEPTDAVICEIARKGRLVSCDIDDFYVASDGQIILVDDCGNAAWVDRERFKVEVEKDDRTRSNRFFRADQEQS